MRRKNHTKHSRGVPTRPRAWLAQIGRCVKGSPSLGPEACLVSEGEGLATHHHEWPCADVALQRTSYHRARLQTVISSVLDDVGVYQMVVARWNHLVQGAEVLSYATRRVLEDVAECLAELIGDGTPGEDLVDDVVDEIAPLGSRGSTRLSEDPLGTDQHLGAVLGTDSGQLLVTGQARLEVEGWS